MKTTTCVTLLMMAAVVSSGCLAQPVVPLKRGDRAPGFRLQASDGKEYALAQFMGKQAVAVCWFPKAGSGGAKIQCAALEKALASLPADTLRVFGCSTQPLDVTTAFAEEGKYSFPVLADADRVAATAYGCLRPDGSSERWTFLIDDKGIILGINKNVTPQTQGLSLIHISEPTRPY